jgi:enoyl-CoA hydratase/carnithine racemase
MTGAVDFERKGNTALWLLDNTRKNNALDPGMFDALDRLAAEAERDRTIRAVILTGKGERAFCAGADIAAWGVLDPVDFARGWIASGHRLFERIAALPVPVLGALRGFVFGGGLELAAACDIRVASADAQFGLPEATIGVTPGWSGAQRVARLMPLPLLREMALTGARLSAERLWSVGFLNEIAAAPLERCLEIGERIAEFAPRAVTATKLVINTAAGESREQAIDQLAGALVAGTADKAEGVRSFLEKRKPRFTGE